MRKYFTWWTFCGLLLGTGLISAPLSTHAQEPEHLVCPHKVNVLDLAYPHNPDTKIQVEQQLETLCKDSSLLFEIISAPAFRSEIASFEQNVLLPLHRDNLSNPNFIVEKGILELRKHRECLLDVCQSIFFLCEGENASAQTFYLQGGNRCHATAEMLLDVQKLKLQNIALGNQARKERTLLRHKFIALFSRFQLYTHGKFIQVISIMDAFVEKITYLLPDPMTGYKKH